ncbi:hypothetical protein ACFUMH_09665 [Cellulomonas sp. NPDC057328]|uniref:hypothetical protein n=1 Tax=Cellulomonas sp. NPDC057328 TaxID=3346101 RepID=UPI00362A0205
MRLQSRWTATLGAVCCGAGVALAAFAALAKDSGDGVNEAPLARWVGATVVLALTTFVWHVTLRPAVLVVPEGLLVRQIATAHQLPWGCIERVELTLAGAVVLHTTAGEIVPFTYSGSLLSALSGAPGARRALQAIEESRSARRSTSGVRRTCSWRVSVDIRPLIVGSAVAGALAWMA